MQILFGFAWEYIPLDELQIANNSEARHSAVKIKFYLCCSVILIILISSKISVPATYRSHFMWMCRITYDKCKANRVDFLTSVNVLCNRLGDITNTAQSCELTVK